MAATRKFLDKVEPHFTEGGKLQNYYGLYEMVDTFLYTPSAVTQGATHVRDGNDLKRTMTYVVLATILCVMMAWYNTGYQANVALESMGKTSVDGWRDYVMSSLGYNSSNPLSCMVHGMLYFFPIYIVTLAVGGIWEVMFATVRKHEVNEGFLVSSMLFTLIMPPDIPLWQVALGISFGGGFLIEESKKNNISKRDILLSLSFLSLCHSIIEDTILILLLGSHISGILFFRFIYTIVIIMFMKYLLDTKDAELVENSPIDSYWGRGKDWNGENKLGKMLMKLREEIK